MSGDTKHFHVQGNVTISPNENNEIGEGILHTNVIKETTQGIGISILESLLYFKQSGGNFSTLSFNSSVFGIENTYGPVNITTAGGSLSLLNTGDVSMTGSLSVSGGVVALGGQHSLTNTFSSQGVLTLRNTSPGGYTSIGFFDDTNIQRLLFGIGNSTSALNTSEAFLNIQNGFDFRVKMDSIDSLKINSNGAIQIFNTLALSSTNSTALSVSGGTAINGVLSVGQGIISTSGSNTIGNITTLLNGNVGIGTTVPERLFHVQGSQGIWRLDRDANTTGLQIHRFPTGNFTTPWKGFLIGVDATGSNNGVFKISDYGTAVVGASVSRFLIDNTGNIGIGTDSPSAKLNVIGTATISGISQLTSSSESTSTATGALVVSGGVGIGGAMYLGSPLNMVHVTVPGAPVGAVSRYYTDISDGLLKSVSSSNVVTTYQPTNTKGDITAHNGTTQERLPVDVINDSYLISNSSTSTGLSWFNKAYAYIRDEKTPGTNGGSSSTGAWFTKVLNTATYYPTGQTFISLDTGTNLITVQPGMYYIQVSSPAVGAGNHTCRIADLTEFVVLINGTAERAQSGGFLGTGEMSRSIACGIVTITTPKLLRIDHRVDTASGVGRGLSTGFQTEVYTTVQIYKI